MAKIVNRTKAHVVKRPVPPAPPTRSRKLLPEEWVDKLLVLASGRVIKPPWHSLIKATCKDITHILGMRKVEYGEDETGVWVMFGTGDKIKSFNALDWTRLAVDMLEWLAKNTPV